MAKLENGDLENDLMPWPNVSMAGSLGNIRLGNPKTDELVRGLRRTGDECDTKKRVKNKITIIKLNEKDMMKNKSIEMKRIK